MKTISTCVIAVFVFSMLFLALPDNGYSGTPNMPIGPPCCQIGQANLICEGGEEAVAVCEGGGGESLCDLFSCTLIDNAVCVDNGDDTSSCIIAPPTLIPAVADVPTLSGWGFLSLAVILGLVGIGAFIARRNKASA